MLGAENDIAVDAGDPIKPEGKIILCGRNDMHEDRHFGGRLAHLSFFDAPLQANQIMAMYAAGAGTAAAMQRTLGILLSQVPANITDSRLAFDGKESLSTADVAQIGQPCFLMPQEQSFNDILYSNTLQTTSCVPGAVCAPKAAAPTVQEGQSFHGVCIPVPKGEYLPEVERHDGSMYFPTPLAGVPVPNAFFPLTSQRLSTWPNPLYEGTNYNAAWVDDETFGSVLQCDANSHIELDPVPYAQGGAFGVNFWIRNKESDGLSFEYIFSHPGEDDSDFSPFYPNQLHVYLPEMDHPGFGVIRTIVKDDDDVYEGIHSETFLDSDGITSSNQERDVPGHIDVDDDTWHMVTVSTRPDGEDGYAVYLDGLLAASNFLPGPDRTAPNGMPFHVDGGGPMFLDGRIYLCGRSDLHKERHFTGKITHLSLFDQALSPENVASLYVSVMGENALTERLMKLAEARMPERTGTLEPIPIGDGDSSEPIVLGPGVDDTVCQSDVYKCPDGRFVGRSGPDCEFDCSANSGPDSTTRSTSNPFENGGYNPRRDLDTRVQRSQSTGDVEFQSAQRSEEGNDGMASAAVVGVVSGLIFLVCLGVLGLITWLIIRKRRQNQNKTSMLALPTRSPGVSRRGTPLDNTCVSTPTSTSASGMDSSIPEEGSSQGLGASGVEEEHTNPIQDESRFAGSSAGGLVSQIQSIGAKSKHTKATKYGEFEDEV